MLSKNALKKKYKTVVKSYFDQWRKMVSGKTRRQGEGEATIRCLMMDDCEALQHKF